MPPGSATQTVRSSDGTQIGVHTLGSGPRLVFVHGAWNWAEHWLGVAEELDDVTAVLEGAGAGAALVGHSSGAIYGLETARRKPPERLVRDPGTPTLLLAGSDNLDHPSMCTEPLGATLPDARVSILEGHGHMANRTDPGLVADVVRAFLAEASP